MQGFELADPKSKSSMIARAHERAGAVDPKLQDFSDTGQQQNNRKEASTDSILVMPQKSEILNQTIGSLQRTCYDRGIYCKIYCDILQLLQFILQ